MALFLVTQLPRGSYSRSLSSVAVVVEAKNGAAAIREAMATVNVGNEAWLGPPTREYSRMHAAPLKLNNVYRF